MRGLLFLCAVQLTTPVSAQEIERATSKKGPVELTLEVASSTIGTGNAPWIAIELRNVGKGTITVVDELFSDRPADIAPAHERRKGPGIFFELKGPDGEEFNFGYRKFPDECLEWNRRSDDPPVAASVGGDSRDDDSHFARNLGPGESVRTREFVFEPVDPRRCAPVRRQIRFPGFQELGAFRFEKPGKYKLRAVYDEEYEAIKDVLKSLNIRRPEDVRVATNWAKIHVIR